MTLFWHHHFATAYSKIVRRDRRGRATRDDGGQAVRGSGGPRRTDRAVARDRARQFPRPARWRWRRIRRCSCGSTAAPTSRRKPQENFGARADGAVHLRRRQLHRSGRVRRRAGVHRLEPDAIARPPPRTPYYKFFYNAAQHDTNAKEFTFPIYPGGGKAHPRAVGGRRHAGRPRPDRRAASVTRKPARAWRASSRPGSSAKPIRRTRGCSSDMRRTSTRSDNEIKPMLIRRASSRRSSSIRRNYFKRYSWPAEFVVRSIKEVGWSGFSVNDALNPMINMGQQLFEPPDVNGWDLGPAAGSRPARCSARMNFAAQLAHQPEVRAAQRRARLGEVARGARLVGARSHDDPGVPPRRRTTRSSTTCGPAAPGPDPTRSCATKAVGLSRT